MPTYQTKIKGERAWSDPEEHASYQAAAELGWWRVLLFGRTGPRPLSFAERVAELENLLGELEMGVGRALAPALREAAAELPSLIRALQAGNAADSVPDADYEPDDDGGHAIEVGVFVEHDTAWVVTDAPVER